MIIKGGSRARASNLAAHVLRTDHNERVRIVELSGVAADNVAGALAEMEAQACGTQATKPLYHVSISPDPKAPPLTKEQWVKTIDRLEERLGLTGCARAVLEHVKDGRTHRHVVWSRTSPLTGRIVADRMNYKVHQQVARELEASFGHAPVCGAHFRPSGHARPRRKPKNWEEQQRARTGVDPHEVKRQATAAWRSADTGRAFQAGLAAVGLTLARGDKAGVMVLIDAKGGLHGLGRRIEGVKAAEIKARLADLDPNALPTVQEARARLKEKDAGKFARGPSRAALQDRHSRRPVAHRGNLPKPSALNGGKSYIMRGVQSQPTKVTRSGGHTPKPPPIPRTSDAPIIDFAIPESGPGINPLEILDTIQKLKQAIGAGAKAEGTLKRMEELYARLMYQ